MTYLCALQIKTSKVMNITDQQRLQKVADALTELIDFFEKRGEFFVFTCAFKKTHELDPQSILTFSDFTQSLDLNIYEAIAMMNKDLIDRILGATLEDDKKLQLKK